MSTGKIFRLPHLHTMMKTLCLGLLLLLSLCHALQQDCKCGECDMIHKDEDKVLWKCQKEPGLAEKEIASKLNSNEAVCLNYRVDGKGECDFRKELVDVALANPIKDICQPSSVYPDRCSIHNHPEFSYKCHRSQQYCAYKMKCPAGYYHMPVITALDLPKDDDGECIDRVTITYESGKVITICGSQNDAHKFNYRRDRFSFLPLTIAFQSSQCCHNCGFHTWLSCVPDPFLAGLDNDGFYRLRGYRNPQRNYMYRDEERGELRVSVPLGAQVIYKDLTITVTKGVQSLYQFTDIVSMKVVDDLFGNRTYYGTAESEKLYGYGTLFLFKDIAVYENERVPSELKPNYLENGYIIDTVKLLMPFLVNSTYESFVEPASKVPLPIIAGKLNRYKPKCQETAEITMGFPHASCKAFEYPTIRDISRALSEAKFLRRSSKNPFVLKVARDAIEMLQDLTK